MIIFNLLSNWKLLLNFFVIVVITENILFSKHDFLCVLMICASKENYTFHQFFVIITSIFFICVIFLFVF